MKTFNKIAAGITLVLGLAATAFAHPDQPGSGMGYGMHHGNGAQGGFGPGAMMQRAQGPQAGNQLMTPEERTALHEKMRAAKTPEERQQIAAANHAEMQKRAQEKGIALPENRGPQGRYAGAPCAGFAAQATTPAQ